MKNQAAIGFYITAQYGHCYDGQHQLKGLWGVCTI